MVVLVDFRQVLGDSVGMMLHEQPLVHFLHGVQTVCVCGCLCECVRVWVRQSVCGCVGVWVYGCVDAWVCGCMGVLVRVRVRVCGCADVCVRVCVRARARARDDCNKGSE